ncbi:MAG: hypothetical protein OEN55_12145 [Alphaproteobacteria bacterium]|nr:hypothetical protein [Alphaproteobacteria bacterium]
MKRIRRLAVKILLGLAAIGVVASVGVVMPRTVRVVGPDGAPVEAWAAHYYHGYRFNFVHPIEYFRPGAIVKTDADGNFRLPARIYLRVPLDGWLGHQIDLLYAPALHSATLYPLAARPIPRIFERSGDGGTLRLVDQTGDPEIWARNLDSLYSFVRYDLMSERARKVSVTPEAVDALARQVIAEYRAFAETHAAMPRTVPTMGMDYLEYQPAAEREAILARIRDDLAREPLWGPYIERSRGRRIAELERKIGG